MRNYVLIWVTLFGLCKAQKSAFCDFTIQGMYITNLSQSFLNAFWKSQLNILYKRIYNLGGDVRGIINLSQEDANADLMITGDLIIDSNDQEPQHGFHIHQYGLLGNDCSDSGGHFNPDGVR